MGPYPPVVLPKVVAQRVPHMLRQALPQWVHSRASPLITRWLQHGVPIPLTSTPPVFFHRTIPSSHEEGVAIRDQIQEYLNSGVISPVPVAPPCIFRLMTTRRADGRFRLIADLRPLNQVVAAPKFKSEDIRTAITMVNPGDFMSTIDLKDGFLHIPVHPSHCQYLGFEWQGDYFQFNALPFGLRASPYVFGKVVREVTTMLRAAGVPVMAYVDDFLITGKSYSECARHTEQVTTLLQSLGWSINHKKSQLEPSQVREYLGFIIDSTWSAVHLKVPVKKVHSLRHDISRL